MSLKLAYGLTGAFVSAVASTALVSYLVTGPADSLCREHAEKSSCADIQVPLAALGTLGVLALTGVGGAVGARLGRNEDREHYRRHGMRYDV